MSASNPATGTTTAPTTYKINLPPNSMWSGDVSSTGSGSTVWITNPYPYTTYWDITIGTDTASFPSPYIPPHICGDTFKWNELTNEFDCQACGHNQKRHVKNHHGEDDHCRDCKTPEQKNILPDGKDGT